MQGFPDKSLTCKKFNRVASSFNQYAFLHNDIRDQLLSRIKDITIDPKVILDLGCGTGQACVSLNQVFPHAQVFGADISEGMLIEARKMMLPDHVKFLSGDIESMILDKCPDLIFSNLAFHWCNPMTVLKHWAESLNENGALLFSTFGPNNLLELQNAWRQIDQDIHVHPSLSPEDLTRLMQNLGYSDVVVDVEHISIEYSSLDQLWKDLKNTASSNTILGRPNGLTSRIKWNRFLDILSNAPKPYRHTIEIVYVLAKRQPDKPIETAKDILIPVDSILTRNM
jgi:malonyl-CoA O-methyltransferase